MSIYLDNAATTAVLPEASAVACDTMTNLYANPASLHTFGFEAEKLLEKSGEYILTRMGKPCTAILVSDDQVHKIYAEKVKASLAKAGFKVEEFVFPHGEQSKNLATVEKLWRYMAQKEITRSDIIVALGGGVTGDLSGFAAANYLRGISFVQIPTSLLAMVDASVGGKTAVDLPEGKNLVGAFWQPELVLCDYRTLATLPQEYVIDGMAEVIKYGFISDNELLETLRVDTNTKIEEIIARAIYDKKVLVEADERDRGSRQLLNLGHTLGHAIEKCSQFSLSHGQAVAIGMILVTKAAVKRCLCPKDVLTELLYLLTKYGLPTETAFTADEIKNAALNDKKRMGQKLTIVLPQSLGKSVLYPIAVEELEEFIKDGLDYVDNK